MHSLFGRVLLTILALAALPAQESHAGNTTDSLKIFYRVGKDAVDPTFRNNGERISQLLDIIGTAFGENRLEKVTITSYASPDGGNDSNISLAESRARTLKEYIASNTGIPTSLIEARGDGIAWEQLREMVSADGDMPGRRQVLDIIDNTPVWVTDDAGNITGGRRQQLMDLEGGRPYGYMLENIFPSLRRSDAVVYVELKQEAGATQGPAAHETAAAEPDTVYVFHKDTVYMQPVVTATAEPQTSAREIPARFIWGIHAGYLASWAESYGLTSSALPSFVAGADIRIRIAPEAPLYLRTGLEFARKGYKVSGFDDSRTVMNSLLLPVALDYAVSVDDRFELVPYAGLYYSLGLCGTREFGGESVGIFGDAGGFSRHDFGVFCGLEALVGRFSIGVSYRPGLIYIDREDRVYGEGSGMIGYSNVKTRGLAVTVGFNF